VNKTAPCIDAIAFIHRFGSSLNGRVRFHLCVLNGVTKDHWTTRYLPFVAVG
jgi:hypothetical protein